MVVNFSSRASRIAQLILIAFFVATSSARPAGAQERGAAGAKSRVVPKLDALPHSPLPRGTFAGWCGEKDRYLIEADGQFEAYDGTTKYATIAVSSQWPWQCSNDGERFVYRNTDMGYLTQVDIATGDSRLLASYQKRLRETAAMAWSPDLTRVVSTLPLKLAADGANIKVIQAGRVRQDSKEYLERMEWSKDGSRFFVAYSHAMEIFDAAGKKLSSGKRANKGFVRNVWFDPDFGAVKVFITPSDQEFTGVVVKCDPGSWKCDRIKPQVDSYSIGGSGIVGLAGPLGKIEPEIDDSTTIHERYAAEIRHPVTGLLARQVFVSAAGRYHHTVAISPSGKTAILGWSTRMMSYCRSDGDSLACQGILIDLSKVPK